MKTIKILFGVLLLLFALLTFLGFLLQLGNVIRSLLLFFSGKITGYEGGRLVAYILFLVVSAFSCWGGIKLIRKNLPPPSGSEKLLDKFD